MNGDSGILKTLWWLDKRLVLLQIVENEYPWLCSLTYNNNHICGITLLSGPPHATILAGAAHCYSPGDSPSSYRVTCGEHSLRSRDDYEVVLQVTDVVVHPRFIRCFCSFWICFSPWMDLLQVSGSFDKWPRHCCIQSWPNSLGRENGLFFLSLRSQNCKILWAYGHDAFLYKVTSNTSDMMILYHSGHIMT